jgi:hypothetical protein
MTNKSIRDYINLIESAALGEVAEGSGQQYGIWRPAIGRWIRNTQQTVNMRFNTEEEARSHIADIGHLDMLRSGSLQIRPYSAELEKQVRDLAEEQLEETNPESIAKISQLTRRP